MYCFPYPRVSDVTPIRVPYIATCRYSIVGPYTFNTFNEYVLCARKPPGPLRNSPASVIQAWLFFGLASEALGRDVEHNDFIEKDKDVTSRGSIDLRISRWFWYELKKRWDKLRNTLPADEYEHKKSHLKQCLDMAQSMVDGLDLDEKDILRQDLVPLLLLVHMLLYVIAQLFHINVTRATQKSTSTKLLVQRMTQNGWCRKRLNILDVIDAAYPCLYFMSSFRQPRGEKEQHRLCTAAKCDIAEGLQRPHHRSIDCRCQDVHVPLEQVTKIVAAGRIPLIRIANRSDEGFELEVIPYTRTTHFTAVSHLWADRQLGSKENALPRCQVEYLDSILAKLPNHIEHWHFRDWLSMTFAAGSDVELPSRTYKLFWIDTFCVPQDPQYSALKHKAIGLMNLIYAAATQTLVLDKGMQEFHPSQQPSALAHAARYTFYRPADESLLDALAQICASNWMGRAWTLQEGVLSGCLIFPLGSTLLYLRSLRTHFFRLPSSQAEDGIEPFRDNLGHHLFRTVSTLLNDEEHREYARDSTARAARFVNSHSLLQSRSTTQSEDLPLIMMNMSGMNGNAISQAGSTEERMKLLFYGLGTLPIELLFSECARVGNCCEVDSWIPREVTPEKFIGDHNLQLGLEGFVFQQKNAHSLKFVLLASCGDRRDQFLVSLPNGSNDRRMNYEVRTLNSPSTQSSTTDRRSWCILVADRAPHSRGARFVISRIHENKIYLHFDCPLRLSVRDSENASLLTNQLLGAICFAEPAGPELEFILEKSHIPQTMSTSRPQNPEQYSRRLIVIHQALFCGTTYTIRFLSNGFLEELLSKYKAFFLLWCLVAYFQLKWIEQALHAFAHRAWIETYDVAYDPDGRWKWFWRLSNYVPPIPFKTLMKYLCTLTFFVVFDAQNYLGVAQVTLYWLPLYPRNELMRMYVVAILSNGVVRLFR